jgi:hypothetical protein
MEPEQSMRKLTTVAGLASCRSVWNRRRSAGEQTSWLSRAPSIIPSSWPLFQPEVTGTHSSGSSRRASRATFTPLSAIRLSSRRR